MADSNQPHSRPECCADCKFCRGHSDEARLMPMHELTDEWGLCARHPPQFIGRQEDGDFPDTDQLCWSQPAIFLNEWCGEFQPRGDKQ